MLDRRIALGFLLGRPPSQGELSDFAVAGDVKRLPIEQVAITNLSQLPGIDQAQLASFPAARSFFSAAELSRVVPAGADFLNQVIDFPRLIVVDKTREAELAFQPVADTYVIEGAIESAVLETAGYRVTAKGSGNSPLSVVGPAAEFTTLEQMPNLHLLKHATVNYPTLPAMRDVDGHVRYLVPNRIDVWFRRGMSQAQVLPTLQAAGLRLMPGREVERRVGLWRAEVIDHSGNALRGMANALSILASREEVLLAEPDELGERDFTPNPVTTMRMNPGTDFTSASQNWNNTAIKLDAGHVLTRGSARVRIFVIDSGIDTDHPNIAPSLWVQWGSNDLNFSIDDALDATSPEAEAMFHGTAVASLATGQGGVSGPLGVAPDCVLVPIKIAGAPMSAGYGMRAAAIHHALDLIGPQERAVINLSWRTAGLHLGIRDAIQRAETLNVPVVVAAGNYAAWQVPTANDINYPAAHAYIEPVLSNVVSVGAVNAELGRASYSYFGDQSVTVAGPGGESGGVGNGVWAAITEGGTGYVAGTSFAAPQVAGLLALILSHQPGLSSTDAITILENTANAIAAAGFALGKGLIQVGAALGASSSGSSPVVSTPLNVNYASIDQLAALPPLCRWHAEGIVSYRESHGPYPSLWHLVGCGRVGFPLIIKLQPLLTV